MKKQYIFMLAFQLLFNSSPLFAQGKISREQYIMSYGDLAVINMNRNGIPASITLAQGMLESDNGNSPLAQKANNHFGIKCHSSWTGKTFYQDDDEKNECFRKYKSVYESFQDHADFLKNSKRYSFLFDLDVTDYKAWAHGLRKAGYATNPKYPQLLIKIIEDNKLSEYDLKSSITKDSLLAENKDVKKELKDKKDSKHLADEDNNTVNPFGRKVEINNRIKYIVVKKDDSVSKIAEEFQMVPSLIYKYNEIEKNSTISKGQILYLQPKRASAEYGKDYHIVKKDEDLHSISQLYGVKAKKILFKNNISTSGDIKAGMKLWLRKRKPVEK
ncbi:MAG: glucosaminidase domain-containing protein [Bacteroidota bacterium]